MISLNGPLKRDLLAAILFMAGILLFVTFPRAHAHLSFVSFAGVALVSVSMALVIPSLRGIPAAFGLLPLKGLKWPWFLAGIGSGILFALLYRNYLEVPVIITRFGRMALLAGAIGATEELLFRGFLQVRLKKVSVYGAVLLATVGHTLYKVILFAGMRDIIETDLVFLASWTFAAGLIFGALRELSNTTLTPVAGHVAFDILVYGDWEQTPWWLWA